MNDSSNVEILPPIDTHTTQKETEPNSLIEQAKIYLSSQLNLDPEKISWDNFEEITHDPPSRLIKGSPDRVEFKKKKNNLSITCTKTNWNPNKSRFTSILINDFKPTKEPGQSAQRMFRITEYGDISVVTRGITSELTKTGEVFTMSSRGGGVKVRGFEIPEGTSLMNEAERKSMLLYGIHKMLAEYEIIEPPEEHERAGIFPQLSSPSTEFGEIQAGDQ